MNFRKPVVWIGVVAVLILIVAGVICLTDTRGNSSDSGNNTGEERNHSETESSTSAGIEEKYVLEPFEKMLASTQVHGYEVQFVYTPLDKKQTVIDDRQQMYKGGEGEFELRTCKDNILFARLPFRSDDMFAYFPVEGFDLVVKDYDGDAAYDDFFIGQGQIPDSAMGNYMKYWLYTVEEDGSIKEYGLSDQLLTKPNRVYSGEFEYKDGKIQYWGLGSNGYDEEQTEKEITGIVRDSSNPEPGSGEEVSAETDQDEQTAEKEYEAVLAKAQIHGYEVRFVYSPQDKKIKKKNGMYEGEFELRTYKDNTLCETRKIKWKGKSKLYYPKKGFELALKDYDSDGDIDDFFIGQGETMKPKDGKSMVYWLFSVNEDGSIWQCTMDNDEKDCLKTVSSNKYSKGFQLFGSKIFYLGVNDNGEEEMKLTKVVGHIQ